MPYETNKNQKKEEVVIAVNDHWVVFVRPVLFSIIGWGIFGVVNFVVIHALSVPIYRTAVLLFAFYTLVVTHHFLFILIIRSLLSSWVITTKRVIDFRMTPMVEDDLAFIAIDKIREIEKQKHGLFQNVLNYGKIVVHVADASEPFVINYIPHPAKFVNLIEAIAAGTMSAEMDPEMLKDVYKRKYSAFVHK